MNEMSVYLHLLKLLQHSQYNTILKQIRKINTDISLIAFADSSAASSCVAATNSGRSNIKKNSKKNKNKHTVRSNNSRSITKKKMWKSQRIELNFLFSSTTTNNNVHFFLRKINFLFYFFTRLHACVYACIYEFLIFLF